MILVGVVEIAQHALLQYGLLEHPNLILVLFHNHLVRTLVGKQVRFVVIRVYSFEEPLPLVETNVVMNIVFLHLLFN